MQQTFSNSSEVHPDRGVLNPKSSHHTGQWERGSLEHTTAQSKQFLCICPRVGRELLVPAIHSAGTESRQSGTSTAPQLPALGIAQQRPWTSFDYKGTSGQQLYTGISSFLFCLFLYCPSVVPASYILLGQMTMEFKNAWQVVSNIPEAERCQLPHKCLGLPHKN